MHDDRYHYNPHAIRWWTGLILLLILGIVGSILWISFVTLGFKIFYGIAGIFVLVCAIYASGWMTTAVLGHAKVDRWFWNLLP